MRARLVLIHRTRGMFVNEGPVWASDPSRTRHISVLTFARNALVQDIREVYAGAEWRETFVAGVEINSRAWGANVFASMQDLRGAGLGTFMEGLG